MATFKNKFKVYSDTQDLPRNKFNMRIIFPSMKVIVSEIYGPLKQ